MLVEVLVASFRPAKGQLERLAGPGAIGGVFGAFVEGHDDVGAQGELHIHRVLG